MADERDLIRRRLGLPPLGGSKPTATFTPDPMDVRDPVTGLTPAQVAARANAQQVATQFGATINAKTGMVSQPAGTIFDPKTNKFVVPPSDADGNGNNDGDGDGTGSTGLTAKQLASQSAFEIFRGFLAQYGLEGLAADVEKYKLDGLSDDELLIRLRTESAAYKRRFKANEARIAKGLAALSEAEYIGLEDQYQNVMRRYGLPESYYARGEMGRQEGFEKFIAGDVSPAELETRVQTAQNRILNAPTQIKDALSQFYGAEISNGDVLAYVLDPDRALPQIQRKVTAAEIGGAAAMAGLEASRARAEELGTYGVTGEQARQGFQTVAGVLPRASMLSDIYAKQGVGPYTQTTAEQEVFGLPSAAEATRRRQKLTELEQAQFSGSSGMAGGALSRERAGSF